jgi:hypothetical protein
MGTIPNSLESDTFILDIGAAKMVNGLYNLTNPSVSIARTPISHCINATHKTNLYSIVECNRWHMRFGHPSYEKLIGINKNNSSVKIVKSNDPCDVCFYAKQKILPFTLSSHISKKVFDLVHN